MFPRYLLLVVFALSFALSGGPGWAVAAAPAPLDSLRGQVRRAATQPARVAALLALSRALAQADSGAAAVAWARRAQALARQHAPPADTLEARCWLALAYAYKRSGRQQAALPYYEQAAACYRQLGLRKQEAQCYRGLGHTHADLNRYPEALAAYAQELRLRRQLGDFQALVECYANIGLLHYEQADYPAALRYQTYALRLAQQRGLQSTAAGILANMAGIYEDQRDFKRAVDCERRALQLHRAVGNAEAAASAVGNLGILYGQQGQYALAERHILECLRAKTQAGSAFDAAVMQAGLGRIYAAQGQHARALRCHWQAKTTFQKLNIPDQLAATLLDMARSYQRSQQLALAALYARQALGLVHRHRLRFEHPKALLRLAEISAARYDFAAAYAYQRQYQRVQDSLQSQEKAHKLAELQARYETQSNQAQLKLLRRDAALQRAEKRLQDWVRNGLGISLGLAVLAGLVWYRRYRLMQEKKAELAASNQELTATQQQLRKSLSEKEVLLKEVHHRVKNNLQIISSLLALQAHEQEAPPVAAALQEGQSWIRSIALIHEMLYQSDDLSSVDSQELLERLTTALLHYWAPRAAVACEVTAAGAVLNTSTAVPLGLIVNELVVNAVKHAFADGRPGRIQVALRGLEPGAFELTVADNGPGLPADFDLERASSLGLRLVSSLALQLDGRLDIRSTPAGACFGIRFREQSETPWPR